MKKCFFSLLLLCLPLWLAAQGQGEDLAEVKQQGTNNSVKLYQGDESHFGGSEVSIEQIGQDNRSQITQVSEFVTTEILQEGRANFINFSGNDWGYREDYSSISLRQSGAENLLFVESSVNGLSIDVEQGDFLAPAYRNEAYIQTGGYNSGVSLGQYGSYNFSSIYQGVMGNYVSILQEGNSNFSVANQPGPYAVFLHEQKGDYNTSIIKQSGEATSTDLLQQGEGNYSYFEQIGSLIYADLTQKGMINRMKVFQNAAWSKLSVMQEGNKNFVELEQVGMYEEMHLIQQGGENKMLVGQSGDPNYFLGSQKGNGNSLDAIQQGSFLEAEINQKGNGHKAFIYQE